MSGSAARTITIRLAVQDDQVREKLEALGQRGEVSLRQIEKAANDASPGMIRLGSVTDGVSRSLGSFGASLVSPTAAISALTTGAVAAGVAIAKIGDDMVNTQARLTAATGSAEAAGRVLADLTKLGQQTGVSVSESAGAFARFSIAAREVGATNAQVIALVRTVQQAGIIAGASTQETTATVLQLGQALASGKLQGDELRSILENMPNLAEALARALGVSVGRLREMGTEGQLTADRVMPALLRAGEQINVQFDRMPVTMARAFDILGVSMTEFVGRLDRALNLSQAISRAAQAAAAAVNAATAAITPRSTGEQATLDVSQAEERRRRLETELASLSGEPGIYAAPRRGTTSRAMQEAGAQLQPRDQRVAELQAQITAENRIIEQGLERRNAEARQAEEVREAEEATAAARRNAAARQTATQAFNTTRDDLDKERKLREDHRRAVETIDRGLIVGATDQAEAARLRNLANAELTDGLRKLTDHQGRNNDSQREANDLLREYNSLRRDPSGVLTMNELDTRAASEITRTIRGTAADPAKRERDAAELRREAEKAAEQVQRQVQQSANSMESTFSGAFTRAFESGTDAGRSFLESISKGVKSLAATIASQLVFRMAVVPVVNAGANALGYSGSLMGMPNTSIGGVNLGGLFGGSGALGAGGTSGGGSSLVGQAGNLSSVSTIQRGIGGFNPGNYMSGATAFNTGFSSADGVLNTSLWGTSAATQASATNAAIGGMGGGLYGPATAEAVAQAGGSATGISGATVGSLGAGALGIGGGLYGIYSGIQKGGVGGYTGAAGGAATAGLSAAAMAGLSVPVYGWIAAALLTIAGALLPGAKPSGKGQEFRVDLLSGDTEKNGLGGSRYSGENASQAESAARSISALSGQLSTALGGARIPGEAAVGVTSSRGDGPGQLYLEVSGRKAQFANSEEGAKDLADKAAEFLLEAFRGAVSGDFTGILNGSPTVEKLQENLTWYDQVYKKFGQSAEAASAFQQQQDQVTATYQASIDKANELALATDRITEARDKELAKLTAARDLNLRAYGIGLDIRLANATGNGGLDAQLAAFDIQAEQQMAQARDQLEQWGTDAVLTAELMAKNEAALAAERLKIQTDFNAEATAAAEQAAAAAETTARAAADAAERASASALSVVTNMRDYLRGLATSDASPGTVLDRFQAAGQDFNAIYGAAVAGDANSISGLQGAAETYRALAREVYGGGQGYADVISMIGDRLGSISDLGADALTQSFIRENSRENTDRIVEASTQLYSEIIAMRADLKMILMRPAA